MQNNMKILSVSEEKHLNNWWMIYQELKLVLESHIREKMKKPTDKKGVKSTEVNNTLLKKVYGLAVPHKTALLPGCTGLNSGPCTC
jgi:hypothetical protein